MADNGLRKYIDNMMSKSSKGLLILLILCASITSTTGGCDSSIMKGLNISASYADYFHLNTATLALNISCVWAGNAISDLFYGQITNALGRRCVMLIAWVIAIVAVRVIGR
jgi:MFS family permease